MKIITHSTLMILAGLGILLGLAACQLGPTPVCTAMQPLINVVRGIYYIPNTQASGGLPGGTALSSANLGPAFDTITDHVGRCDNSPVHGNYSTVYDVGTKLYTVKGYQPWFRLAVQTGTAGQQSITLLEAAQNPNAHKGSELMQLDDNVDAILLYSKTYPTDGGAPNLTTVANIRDAQKIAKLIALFDQAPIKTAAMSSETIDTLAFHFNDGTVSFLPYDLKTGWTNRSIILPSDFATLITATPAK